MLVNNPLIRPCFLRDLHEKSVVGNVLLNDEISHAE